jgi:hypothetical protein
VKSDALPRDAHPWASHMADAHFVCTEKLRNLTEDELLITDVTNEWRSHSAALVRHCNFPVASKNPTCQKGQSSRSNSATSFRADMGIYSRQRFTLSGHQGSGSIDLSAPAASGCFVASPLATRIDSGLKMMGLDGRQQVSLRLIRADGFGVYSWHYWI